MVCDVQNLMHQAPRVNEMTLALGNRKGRIEATSHLPLETHDLVHPCLVSDPNQSPLSRVRRTDQAVIYRPDNADTSQPSLEKE